MSWECKESNQIFSGIEKEAKGFFNCQACESNCLGPTGNAPKDMKIPPQRVWIPPMDREFIKNSFDSLCETGQFAYAKNVEKFEKAFARFIGRKYAVATGSCTQALEIAWRALFLKPYRQVIVPTNTYMATANAILNAGHKISLCDCDGTMNYSTGEVKWYLDEDRVRNGGFSPVHIGGNISSSIPELMDECKRRGVAVVEDAAHAHGSKLAGKKAGTFGDVACFSFYPTKIMTVGGEGGMLVTDRDDIAEFARRYRHHGRKNDKLNPFNYQHVGPGNNFCMDEFRAIVGLTQLKRLPEFIKTRNRIAKIYKEKFTIIDHPGCNHYKIITLDKILIRNKNIKLSGQVYRNPLHDQPAILTNNNVYRLAELCGADKFCLAHSCLPVYNNMTDEEAEIVMAGVDIVEHNRQI